MDELRNFQGALLAAAEVLFAGACATTAPEPTADADRQICTREVPSGKLRPAIRCRAIEDVRRDEADAERTLNAARATATDATGR